MLRNIPLQFVSKRVQGGGSKPVDSSLPLVPIIDLMICMVVFLLMSFSSSGELLAQRPSLRMPTAEKGKPLDEAIVTIVIDPTVVLLDDRRVADTTTLAKDAKVERIEPLVVALENTKRNWATLHPRKEFSGEITLQADVSIDYRVIKKVMYSAAQAGYGNVRFAVNRARP